MQYSELVTKTRGLANKWGLFSEETRAYVQHNVQFDKHQSEFTETEVAFGVMSRKGIIDGLGDQFVTIQNSAEWDGFTIEQVACAFTGADDANEAMESLKVLAKEHDDEPVEAAKHFHRVSLLRLQDARTKKKGDAAVQNAYGEHLATLVRLAVRAGFTPEECFLHAYNDIKDRKGLMKQGAFVKFDDLTPDEQAAFEEPEAIVASA